ncbi:MAG: bifunctional (p)ppGpp synthetase/guanosine-3',5'-bis(diphosphate) 3'-pyrophosphohydrolase [Bacteroidia bacterium]|nr:bifunctional (p)ppGpp synthetase/guanosine-3',5'-bis(diphosphate) 3'-pyrophosphohydrolase [Bacteroidia bacterium]
MFTDKDNAIIEKEFEVLRLASLKRCANQGEYEVVLKAFDFAKSAHNGVRRRSGEPYIIHPISVAQIVVQEIGLGYKSIVSALIHDVVEDTEYTLEDIERLFGAKIASLVDGLTKIKSAFDSQTSSQAENFRRILLTLNDDVRVILIKLADRLHNMRTLEYMPDHKKSKILSETMYIFIPLAHRLGLYSIKSELENIWLYHTLPAQYEYIQSRISQTIAERGCAMDEFIEPISESLRQAGYKFNISKRTKTPYSIWRKMESKSIPFEQIYDLYAVRIVFDPKENQPERIQCWHIYSLITELYLSKTDRIRDWVSTPKINGYEALHCTVMGPQGNWVEIQIRSVRMNDLAERGVAAHWSYKSAGSPSENEMDKWLNMVREVLENPDSNALEFLDRFHSDLLSSEIYVFTPKGESRSLVKGSTALDFAYSIHSEIGSKAIAAKANFKLVPISYELRNGDQIEIITAESQKPQREWLDYAKTPKAKSFIMDALKSEIKDHLKSGQTILDEKLSEMGIKPQARVYRKLTAAYGLNNREELFSKIGAGILDLSDLSTTIKKSTTRKRIRFWNLQFSGFGNQNNDYNDNFDDEEEDDNGGTEEVAPVPVPKKSIDNKKDFLLKENPLEKTLSYQVARCCKPIPGDKVIGFIDDNGEVIVHKNSCPEAIQLASRYGNKIVKAKWTKHTVSSFLARISMRGIDRIGILNELTQFITLVLNVNIRKIFIETHDGIFEGFIDLYVHNTEDLDKIIKQMSQVKGVENVIRTELKED